MTDSGWLYLWQIVLGAALIMFTCLAVVITIGGFLDMRTMLGRMRREHEERKL